MTLVDLPGIAKVAVGDQPGDIEARIRRMVLEYIRHPTCVILAVSAANADLVNSDALELARAADPEGRRTVGARSPGRPLHAPHAPASSWVRAGARTRFAQLAVVTGRVAVGSPAACYACTPAPGLGTYRECTPQQ